MNRINVVTYDAMTHQTREAIQQAFKEIGLTYIGTNFDVVEQKTTLMFDDYRDARGDES